MLHSRQDFITEINNGTLEIFLALILSTLKKTWERDTHICTIETKMNGIAEK